MAVWAFARAYYFAFYVIQHYIDPSYRFAGLGGALAHGWKTVRRREGVSAPPGGNSCVPNPSASTRTASDETSHAASEPAGDAPAAVTAFERVAATYDANRRRLLPDIDDFYGAVPRVLADVLPPVPRVLDLGAGTGLLSAYIAERFPDARLVLSDLSEGMLAQARQRFTDRQEVTYRVLDNRALDAHGEYDAVVSALSLHHLEDEEKADVFARIFAALKPGGWFVNADHIRGETPETETLYERVWQERLLLAGVTSEERAEAQRRVTIDRNALLSAQLRWLADAGFAPTDGWYHHFRFAVFGGQKPCQWQR